MEKATAYITNATGTAIMRTPFSGAALAALPNAIRFQYLLEKWELCGVKVAALMPQGEGLSPKELCRHADIVQDKMGFPVVLVFNALPAYVRKRIAGKGRSFVVTGRQIFMPRVMLLVNERIAREKIMPRYLSAPAQLLVLYHLQNKVLDRINGLDLAHRFGGSAMTWSRALSELVALAAGEETKLHKFRYFRFVLPPRKLWEKLLPNFRTPVLKDLWVKSVPAGIPAFAAGHTALSGATDMAEPDFPVYAIAKVEYRKHKGEFIELPWPEDGSVSLQVWRYDPEILARGKSTDTLSLYLSLQEDQDERAAKAREQLLKGIAWLKA